MKKLILMALGLVSLPYIAGFAKTKTVTVSDPGTLQSKLRVKDLKGVDRVAIAGVLNNDDVVWLRQLCGSDTATEPMEAYIVNLDLAGVSFDSISGRRSFVKTARAEYGIDGAHVLPACMFYGTKVEQLVLPTVLDSVAPFSLGKTCLREISIPDGIGFGKNAVIDDSCLQSLRLPAMRQAFMPKNAGLPALRHISYGNVGYVPSASFAGMPELETVVFEGSIGHIDGYQFKNNTKLKSVTFNGPILTTGGPQLAENCPELESVTVNAYVPWYGLKDGKDCPKFDSVTVNGAINAADFEVVANIAARQMASTGFEKRMAFNIYNQLVKDGEANGYTSALASLKEAHDKYYDPDTQKSKLQILKESAPYDATLDTVGYQFTYAAPSDSLLTLSREYYNLDSIAGNGDDLSKIKNLLYWVHDLVPHDGTSAWPTCPLTLRDLDRVCKEEYRGVNCRMMAIMLTEALLAEGIPARYLTCQSKAYDEDPDCHVICVAWSRELGKWVWADPTFGAYVTDENDNWLHPGEVRERLINDEPLVLNPDANWNHKENISKAYYLDHYMAKNLYLIEAYLHQQAAPEGPAVVPGRKAQRNEYVTLLPAGFNYAYPTIHSSDPAAFWSSPE